MAGSPLSILRQYWPALLCLWPVGCFYHSHPLPPAAQPDTATTLNIPVTLPLDKSVVVKKPVVVTEPVVNANAQSVPPTQSTKTPGWHELILEGFEPSLVYYRPKAPKLVITHGAGGQAQWHCEHYQRILAGNATLVCPRGKRLYSRDPSRGYYYPDHLELSQEVAAAITAFEEQFEAPEPQEKYLYAGYSQGATMGALAFASQGDRFSHLILVEGGYADFSLPLTRRFKNSGGQGALFICGTEHCRDKSRNAVARFKQLGLKAESHWAPGAGHRPDGPVTKALVSALPFVLLSDPRWKDKSPTLPEDVLAGNG